MAAVGIDLGTTNSCIAVINNGRPEIITNPFGQRTTSSFIGFYKNEIHFGDAAKKMIGGNIENTIFGVKRMIGRKLSDPSVQADKSNWKFNIIEHNDKLTIPIKMNETIKYYTPEELSALLLKYMKRSAEQYLKMKVVNAVITVPAHFNDLQRQATVDAGKIAGFDEVKLLNEPTAAAIAYALDKTSNHKNRSLIFDLGGGTFDVSIITFKNNEIDVNAISGDSHLGGDNIDNTVCNYFKGIIQKELNFDASLDARKYYRLMQACENVKKDLAVMHESKEIELVSFNNDDDFTLELTRDKFDELNKDLFDKTMEIVDICLKDANIERDQIDDVILVGGSTKNVKIRTLLEDYFGKPAKRTINPDEAVALGAAIEAARWNNDSSVKTIIFNDITSWSLGVELENKEMDVIIPRFSKIPTYEQTEEYCTVVDNQTEAIVNVFYGEDRFAKNNYYLGKVIVHDIKPAKAFETKIYVTFSITSNGILHVKAITEFGGKEFSSSIILERKGGLTEKEIKAKQGGIEEIFDQGKETTKFKETKDDLEQLCYNIIDSNHDIKIITFCKDSLNWLPSADISKLSELLSRLSFIKQKVHK